MKIEDLPGLSSNHSAYLHALFNFNTVSLAASQTQFKTGISRHNDAWAKEVLEDMYGSSDLLVFGDLVQHFQGLLIPTLPLSAREAIRQEHGQSVKVVIKEARLLDQISTDFLERARRNVTNLEYKELTLMIDKDGGLAEASQSELHEQFAGIEINNKPIVDLTREDLASVAEELHWAEELYALYSDHTDYPTYANELSNVQDCVEAIEAVFGTDTFEEIYNEVKKRHEGEPSVAQILQQLQRLTSHSAWESFCVIWPLHQQFHIYDNHSDCVRRTRDPR